MAKRGSIEHNFSHHPPKRQETIGAHEAVRAAGRAFAEALDKYCHDSREKSLALTKTEEAVMWANACIARCDDAGVR